MAEAKRHLEVAVAQAPNDAEAKNDLGMALINLGEMEPAAAQFRAAIETDPSLAKPHYNLGIYHARTSDLDLAEELIAEAVRLSPEYPRAWAALGRIYSMKGNTTAALPTLERALEQTPSSPDVILLYAEALIEGGRREDARALLPKLESLDPARAETLKSLLGG